MSLEDALTAHTAAVEANTKAILTALSTLAGQAVAPAAPAAAATAEAKPAKAAKTKAAAPAAAAPVAAAGPTAKTVTDTLMAIAKTNRAGVTDLLKKFGAERISGLKPEQYAEVMAEAAKLSAPAQTAAAEDSLI
jgi:hypothetical protein